jgi:hypothetical protein
LGVIVADPDPVAARYRRLADRYGHADVALARSVQALAAAAADDTQLGADIRALVAADRHYRAQQDTALQRLVDGLADAQASQTTPATTDHPEEATP